MMKVHSKKGFTLVEVLIVVAIIAILAAIAIPMYSAQMEKSRVAIDKANLESAKSMAVTDWLIEGFNAGKTYTAIKMDDSSNGQMTVTSTGTGTKFAPQSTTYKDAYIQIEIDTDGEIVKYGWTKDGTTYL